MQTEQARKQGPPWPLDPALNSQGGKCDLRVVRGIKPFPPHIYSGQDASLQQQKANENRSLCLKLSLLYEPDQVIGGRGEEHCGSIRKFGLKMLRAWRAINRKARRTGVLRDRQTTETCETSEESELKVCGCWSSGAVMLVIWG